MGGLKQFFGLQKKSTPEAPKPSQATEYQTTIDEMAGSEKKRRTRAGKKRLQIPGGTTTGLGAPSSGGTGLNTGN